jgi:acetylserotonin N-methyltransferase
MKLGILELPQVCELAREYARTHGVSDRIEVVASNMFKDPWPQGCDAHFLSNVFHDWDAETCRLLAKKSFDALPPGGRIHLHESLLNETRDGPPLIALYSMNMARVTERGKQYSASELEAMLSDAGFRDVRVRHLYSIFSLVSARKP